MFLGSGLGVDAEEFREEPVGCSVVGHHPHERQVRHILHGCKRGERLAGHMPAFAHLSPAERQELLTDMQYVDAPEGAPIVRQGEVSDVAYFILDGGAIAGRKEKDQDRVLEVLNAGDFFGEIAALTGVPRTANVVTNKAAGLLRVPAATLRLMMQHTELYRMLVSELRERLTRMDIVELPKMLAYDQNMLRDLRTPDQPTPAPAPAG